jgi:hypothetical protein
MQLAPLHYGAGTSPLDAEGSSSGLGPLPAAEASAAEQLAWLKEASVEHSGKGGWEDTAQGVGLYKLNHT